MDKIIAYIPKNKNADSSNEQKLPSANLLIPITMMVETNMAPKMVV